MRQRHHVAGASVVVQQQVRMRRRHCRMRERPARLAGLQRRIDPRPVEKAPADLGQIGAERAIRRQHPLARIVPRDRAVVVVGQRRVAVPVHQLRQAEPLRLHQVVAMRQPREIGAHRRDQCVDNLILHHVGAIAVAAGARVVAEDARPGPAKNGVSTPSRSTCCCSRKRTSACATVRRTVIGHLPAIRTATAGRRPGWPTRRENHAWAGSSQISHARTSPGPAITFR